MKTDETRQRDEVSEKTLWVT